MMLVWEVKCNCFEFIVFLLNFDCYRSFLRVMFNIFCEYIDLVEFVFIDEGYMDMIDILYSSYVLEIVKEI